MSSWELAGLAAKFIGLCATAGVIGGGFMFALSRLVVEQAIRKWIVTYILVSAITGLVASSVFFLMQIGAVNDAGLNGMWDTQMIRIFAVSGLGTATGLRLPGYAAALLLAAVLLVRRKHAPDRAERIWPTMCLGVVGLLLGYSFQLTGHVALLGPLARAAIVVHVLGVFAWTGALVPLLLCLRMQNSRATQALLTQFGSIAVFILTALFASGMYVAIQLVGSVELLFSTLYGQLLVLKLTGVLGLIAIAGLNKFILVPRLQDPRYRVFLQRSIAMEVVVALLVLGVTSYFTTGVEPAH